MFEDVNVMVLVIFITIGVGIVSFFFGRDYEKNTDHIS